MEPFAKQSVYDEMEVARARFHSWLDGMSAEEMSQASNGTRWTNEELLFHMLFGYMIVLALIRLVKVMGFLPRPLTKPFAMLLDAFTGPFNWINYVGSKGGAKVFNRNRMGAKFDRVIASLGRHLAKESSQNLARGMCYPTRWDPFFEPYMTLADIYHYPTLHFDFHARQLSVDADV